MKINIQRQSVVTYDVDVEGATLLEMLNEIKRSQDPSLAYSSGCRSSVCGSCSVRVNGREVLACSYHAKDGDLVEPLRNAVLLRDLVVDMDMAYSFNAKAKAWQSSLAENVSLSIENQ